MADLDVWVSHEDRASALKLAQSLGYLFPEGPNIHSALCEELSLKLNHHHHLKGGVGHIVILELHFRLLTARIALSREEERWFWNQTQTIEYGGVKFRIHKPEAQLLHLVAHALLVDGETNVDLLHLLDLHLLITESDLDWGMVIEKAISHRWASPVERALTLIVQLFETPVPPPVFQELRCGRLSDEDVLLVGRLSGKGSAWEKVKSQFVGLPRPEGFRWAVQLVFPPVAYMRHRYDIPATGLVLPYYLIRWLNQASHVQAWARLRLSERLLR
jgi:hypothetical protein